MMSVPENISDLSNWRPTATRINGLNENPAGGKDQPLSFGDHVKMAQASTEKETNDNQQTLSQAKGRAQITATTAMSIVNVALLKNVIDQGPNQNKYYMTSLVLISVSLCLQVFAGILSLIIEHMLTYMSKYGQNMCEDFKQVCCPWRCVKGRRDHKGSTGDGHDHTPEEVRNTNKGMDNHALEMEDPWSRCDTYKVPMKEKGEPICGCCPLVCIKEVYTHSDVSALQKYYSWKCKSVDVELNAIRAEDELQYQNDVIAAANSQLLKLLNKETTETTSSTDGDRKQEILELQQTLSNALDRKREHETSLRKAGTIRDQGNLLEEFVESTRKNRVMMLSAFWQHILNYVFYIIFILNAFITGFGLASSSTLSIDESSSGTTTFTPFS